MRGLPADDRPPLGQQLWQRGVDRGRRLSFAFVGPDLGAVKIRLDIRTGLAWPGVTNSRTTDITGFRTTGNASIMAAGTSYTTTSVLEAGALVQCHDGAPLRLSHALLLGENPRTDGPEPVLSPHRPGDGGILTMPLRDNVPEPPTDDWQLTTCPVCGAECWQTDTARRILALEPDVRTACTACALKGLGK